MGAECLHTYVCVCLCVYKTKCCTLTQNHTVFLKHLVLPHKPRFIIPYLNESLAGYFQHDLSRLVAVKLGLILTQEEKEERGEDRCACVCVSVCACVRASGGALPKKNI